MIQVDWCVATPARRIHIDNLDVLVDGTGLDVFPRNLDSRLVYTVGFDTGAERGIIGINPKSTPSRNRRLWACGVFEV